MKLTPTMRRCLEFAKGAEENGGLAWWPVPSRAVYKCAKAGWLEPFYRGPSLMHRITDAGRAALERQP